MKFWNKSKDVRLRLWHRVSLPSEKTVFANREYSGWRWWGNLIKQRETYSFILVLENSL